MAEAAVLEGEATSRKVALDKPAPERAIGSLLSKGGSSDGKTIPCPKCGGTGTYLHHGRCYACVGKGFQTRADIKRCTTYMKYNTHV